MKIEFTTKELEYLIQECQFNEENGELEVLKLRNKGKSRVAISMELHMSVDTVTRRLNSIKNKIKKVNNLTFKEKDV